MITFSNTLHGPAFETPSTELLSLSGDPMTAANASRSLYSNLDQIWEYNNIALNTGYSRNDTLMIGASGLNSLPFSMRWYCRFPTIPTGNGERRWLARFGNMGLIGRETSYGNFYMHMSPLDIAAAEMAPVEGGTARPTDQWLRIELQYVVENQPVFRVFNLHDTDVYREFTFNGADLTGGEFHLTGFRYRRRTTIQWGSSGSGVAELQRELIAIGYLPDGSDDGIYGEQLFNAIVEFQGDHGLVADGAAGSETRAAIDFVRGQRFEPVSYSLFAAGDGDWIGPEPDPIPPLPDPDPYPMTIGLNV